MLIKCLLAVMLLSLLSVSCTAEIVRFGQTRCLLEPPAGEDSGRRYALFVGSGDYFQATRNCEGLSASDGTLLIPEGDGRFELCSRASDQVISDIRDTVLSWAREGHEVILIGYSAGGYPATALAVYLAQEGFTGKLYLLDGIYGDYRGITYNADYYRTGLSSWDVTMCASASTSHNIAERSRKVCGDLMEDSFADCRQYDGTHEDLKALYLMILAGEKLPDPASFSFGTAQ